MRTSIACLLVLGCLSGCDGEAPSRLTLVGTSDGQYLRGLQVARFEVKSPRSVVRSELFLDRLRVATDELAPFELEWDTRDFVEGSHELTARAYLDDGTYVDGDVAIRIDNTPPRLDLVPAFATRGQPFLVPAADNGVVARVEVSRGVDGEAPKILSSAPFQFYWPWACGKLSLDVLVVDGAGAEVSGRFEVTGNDLDDLDCDGHTTSASGGDDCDDQDAAVYPGAFEYPEGIDRNCDGATATLEGVDFDHDGVPSITDGGGDCNDTDASVHGGFLVLAHQPLYAGGEPLRWNPGEAVLTRAGPFWELFLNRGGVVERVTPGPSGDEVTIAPVATGANPGSIAASGGDVAFGRGKKLVIVREQAGQWLENSVIQADATVGRIALEGPYLDAEYAAFQAGTKVWFASSFAGGAWTTQLLADAGAPLAQAPFLWSAPAGANVVFRTASAAWKADRYGTDTPLVTRSLGPEIAVTTAVGGYTNLVSLVAVETSTGAALYAESSSAPVASFAQRVTAIFGEYPYLFVQLEGTGVRVLDFENHYRQVQTIADVAAFDTATWHGFAGDGSVHSVSESSIGPAVDLDGDGVDIDCDGYDG